MRSSVSALQGFCLGAAASLAAITLNPGQVEAYVVTVGGVKYDVTTFTGSYNANTSKFALPPAGAMPWWGSLSMTNDFAQAVGTSLGVQNIDANSGPFFAYSINSVIEARTYSFNTLQLASVQKAVNVSTVWAQATRYVPTPGPLPLLGAGAAFGFSRRLRKRIQSSRQPLASQALRA